jgi:hypothetical protein
VPFGPSAYSLKAGVFDHEDWRELGSSVGLCFPLRCRPLRSAATHRRFLHPLHRDVEDTLRDIMASMHTLPQHEAMMPPTSTLNGSRASRFRGSSKPGRFDEWGRRNPATSRRFLALYIDWPTHGTPLRFPGESHSVLEHNSRVKTSDVGQGPLRVLLRWTLHARQGQD